MSEHKPCPFCGAASVMLSVERGSTYRWCSVQCGECSAKGPEVRVRVPGGDDRSGERAFAAWDERPTPGGYDASNDAQTIVSPDGKIY